MSWNKRQVLEGDVAKKKLKITAIAHYTFPVKRAFDPSGNQTCLTTSISACSATAPFQQSDCEFIVEMYDAHWALK